MHWDRSRQLAIVNEVISCFTNGLFRAAINCTSGLSLNQLDERILENKVPKWPWDNLYPDFYLTSEWFVSRYFPSFMNALAFVVKPLAGRACHSSLVVWQQETQKIVLGHLDNAVYGCIRCLGVNTDAWINLILIASMLGINTWFITFSPFFLIQGRN